jgi:hypothetical protein
MILKSDSISAVHTDQCDSAAGNGIGNIDPPLRAILERGYERQA